MQYYLRHYDISIHLCLSKWPTLVGSRQKGVKGYCKPLQLKIGLGLGRGGLVLGDSEKRKKLNCEEREKMGGGCSTYISRDL